jgi:hypothetical protein
MNLKWEAVNTTFSNISIKRMRTPSGWILRTDEGESVIYIHDESGAWLNEEKLTFYGIPSSGKDSLLRRSKIPGGWLLARFTNKSIRVPEGEVVRLKTTELTFVPDPEWKWVINYSSLL